MTITITEALAEIKTNLKKVEKKEAFIAQHLAREDRVRDPLEKVGGQATVISHERQAIQDLLARNIELRAAIQRKNLEVTLHVSGQSATVAEWLIWKRDVAPIRQRHLQQLSNNLTKIRQQAQQRNVGLVSASASVNGEVKPTDIVVNISETELLKQIEEFEQTFGELDGRLSILNATTMIDV